MATSTPTSDDRLPSTLFTVYQTYKRGTSVILEWLSAFDKPPARGPRTIDQLPSPAPAPGSFTVKQLLDRAKKASKHKRIPPTTVHDAFRIVLVNRNKLTRYYEGLPAASTDTVAATTRHKVFNETLAQAYTLLFISQTSTRNTGKPINNASQADATPTVNAFEALAHIVEEEPDFEASASDFWQAENFGKSAESTINDDSVGDAVALHAYVTELQNIVEAINGVWQSVANGHTSLAAGGWLTNVAESYMNRWIHSQSPFSDYHAKIINAFFHAKDKPEEQRGCFAPMWLEDPDGLKASSERDEFLDLTHGYGLIWAYSELENFNKLVKSRDESLSIVERRRFEDYFKTQSEQHALKRDFVKTMADYLPTKEANTLDEHYRKITSMSTDRYTHDADIVKSMCRSIYQHPLWNGPMDDLTSTKSGWATDLFREDKLQFQLGVPLLVTLKQAQQPNSVVQTTLVMGTHMFLESCRSFIQQRPKHATHRTNNRIQVLSFANNSRKAIQKLLEVSTDPVKAGLLRPEWCRRAIEAVKQLDNFISTKVFDLYSQSPWVTGSYMATIAARNMFLGCAPLNHDGSLSNMLHMYNMLRQIRFSCPRIPILEHLCDILGPAIFPHSAGRPTSNFDNTARVTNGQGLIFKNNGTPQLTGLKKMIERKNRVTKMPPIGFWNLSKFATQTMIYQGGLYTDILIEMTDKRLSTKKHDVFPTILARFTPSDIILRAKELIRPEFEGPFPIAQVNFFAVVDMMLNFFKEVAGHISKPGGLPEDMQRWVRLIEENVGSVLDVSSNTVKAANNFLEQARLLVDHQDVKCGAAGLKRARQNECLALLRDAMVKVCGDVKPEDYLWKDM